MFKDLGNLFEKKKKLIGISENRSLNAIEVANLFLKSQFGHSSQNKLFTVSHNQKEGILFVEAGNKILANELSLHLAELYNKFQERKIRLTKILIR